MFAKPLHLRLGLLVNQLSRRPYSKMESSNNPLAGLWKPNPLKGTSSAYMLLAQMFLTSVQRSTMVLRL